MQEIEVKARVSNSEQLLASLKERGVALSEPISQDDTIYAEPDWDFVKFQSDRNILRIRIQDGRAILTLKRPGVNELHSIEHETGIEDADQMHEILGMMGYVPVVQVAKLRRKAKYGELEICYDEVKKLGTYIEVEKLQEDGSNAEAVQEELFQFLETVGVNRDDREERGYDTLMELKRSGKL